MDPFSNILQELEAPNRQYAKTYPGESEKRQPVHTVYGGAHLFKHNTTQKLGELALRNFQAYAPDVKTFSKAFGLEDPKFAEKIYTRVNSKLEREAVEDFRIDFEDGFGYRPDAEEDETAKKAAHEVVQGMAAGTLSPFVGIRIKTLSEELKGRALRTLNLFVSTLARETKGKLPDNFVVTLPKIVHPAQVTALVKAFEALEKDLKLTPQSLVMEFMIETPQSVLDMVGHCAIPKMVEAAQGRCVAAHFGTYDYTASLSITAEHQTMVHEACDFAKHMMKVSLAGTGIWLSDGATNVMPVEIHKSPKSEKEKQENIESIHRAWRLAFDHNMYSLKNAFYQGWDLHPGQLPVRYASLYTFFLKGLDSATARLSNFIHAASKATLVGDVFDDAATGQGLLNYFLRALNCGAITEEEVLATGLSSQEIRLRSFKKILESRTQG